MENIIFEVHSKNLGETPKISQSEPGNGSCFWPKFWEPANRANQAKVLYFIRC